MKKNKPMLALAANFLLIPFLVACGGGGGGGDEVVTDPTINPSGVVDTPKSFSLSSISTDSATASWNYVQGITYTLYVSQNSTINPASPAATGETRYTTENASKVITGLQAGTTYFFAVTAADTSNSISGLSNIIQVTTPTSSTVDTTPPSTPTQLGITGSSTSTLTLQWAPSLGARQYQVFLNTDVSVEQGTKILTASTPYELSNLSPGTTYFLAVQAINDAGQSSVSSVISASTNSLPTAQQAPVAPSAVSISNVTANSFVISWPAVADADSYIVEVNGSQSAAGQTSFTASNLSPGQNYNVSVFAINAAGTSPASTLVQGTTMTPPIVRAAATRRLNDTGIIYSTDSIGQLTALCNSPDSDWQDCNFGRDVGPATSPGFDAENGWVGFDFTRISKEGYELPITDKANTACIKDNTTGLIWEVKTNDGGLHDHDHTYTHETNGGPTHTCNLGTACNVDNYINAVSSENYCGSNSWDLPTLQELQSIVSYNRGGLSGNAEAIDFNFFPYFKTGAMWTRTGNGPAPESLWLDSLGLWGFDSDGVTHSIRLVRKSN